jgi:hypothetical protein
MATGTRRAARLLKSQDRGDNGTESSRSEPPANPTIGVGQSEPAVRETEARRQQSDDNNLSEGRSSEEDEEELERYTSLTQEELENCLRKTEAHTMRRR